MQKKKRKENYECSQWRIYKYKVLYRKPSRQFQSIYWIQQFVQFWNPKLYKYGPLIKEFRASGNIKCGYNLTICSHLVWNYSIQISTLSLGKDLITKELSDLKQQMMSLAWFLSLNKRFFFIAMSFLETSKYDLVKHFISVEDGLGIFFFSILWLHQEWCHICI